MRDILLWASAHPLTATAAGVALLAAVAALVWLLVRSCRKTTSRTPVAVVAAALAAMACTAYSADTSWRFAAHKLGMHDDAERAAMFAAAELALFSTALMARQNLRTQGAPGTPGVLVWAITGVQVIPAYAESGIVGGTVRAVVGPVLAAMLWHLAMGIELRHAKPGAGSASLPAMLIREARERLLSRVGLAQRNRSAEQITRDRWTVKAVGLAAKLADMDPQARGRARVARRLSVAVGRAQAGIQPEQRQRLLELLAARRHATALATISLPFPWHPESPELTGEVTSARTGRPLVMPVMPTVAALPPAPFLWEHVERPQVTSKVTDTMTGKVTGAVAAEQSRQVVTEVVTEMTSEMTTGELRTAARRLNRTAVKTTARPVTIDRLRIELGLSRRQAADLRREIIPRRNDPTKAP
ncbi:hypothetical protein ACFVTP_11920 [Streptomyces celluloflavus]|uniref:hypothetical protein n=1 Tax=Streptomyces celluloflavus TaxID=58344 RepID=UPI0036D9E775